MNTNLNRTITLAATIGIALTACGGSDAADSTPAVNDTAPAAEFVAESGADELGGVGQWTNEQICALSTAEAVSLAFGFDVEERPAEGDGSVSTCFWEAADDPLGLPAMTISNRSGWPTDGLSADEDLDIPGADKAGYTADAGGVALVNVVVGDETLAITFVVGTEGASEFVTAIGTVWAANQS